MTKKKKNTLIVEWLYDEKILSTAANNDEFSLLETYQLLYFDN